MEYSYLFPVMLGVCVSGWDLTLVDLCGPSVEGVETCVGPSGSAGTSGAIRLGSCDVLESSISTTCLGASCPSISTPGISTFPSGSISDISISSSYSSESTPGNSTSPSSELTPTPGVYISPMRRPCLSVKVIILGWSLTNVLMRSITVSDMGIKSQSFQTIFLPEFNATNLYPPWIFPLGPRHISLLILGSWLLRGLSSLCTLQYCTICIQSCFWKYNISPDIMVLGIRLSEIPPFFRNKFIIFTMLRTI